MRNILLTIIIGLSLVACDNQLIFSEFRSFGNSGWHMDSIAGYTLPIHDSLATYEVQIIVRHTTQYPYQNLWLFTEEWYGNVLLHRDTIECFMADEYGRWNGRGIQQYTLPLLYDNAHAFPKTGDYTITIQQGMRMEQLRGITDIGVKILKNH